MGGVIGKTTVELRGTMIYPPPNIKGSYWIARLWCRMVNVVFRVLRVQKRASWVAHNGQRWVWSTWIFNTEN